MCLTSNVFMKVQVEEIALLNTTLTRPDGARLLYPNIVMASMGVINLARSGNHSENFAVRLGVHTSVLCFIKASQQNLGNLQHAGGPVNRLCSGELNKSAGATERAQHVALA